MGTKGIYLFGTKSDYEEVLSMVEAKCSIKYVLSGLFNRPTLIEYTSGLNIENLGVATTGNAIAEKCYIVVEASTEIPIERIPRGKSNASYYSIDVLAAPTGIEFQPGGLFENRCLINGFVGTASEDTEAIALCRLFVRTIKKRFTRIRHCWLGPEALRLFDEGMRLTKDVDLSEEYSLKRDPGNTYR